MLPGLLVCEQAGGRVREVRVEPKPAGPPFCTTLSPGVEMEKRRSCVPCPSHPSSASSATCKVRCVQVFACKRRRSPFQVVCAAQADMSIFSLKKGKQMISAGPSSTTTTCQKT